MTEGEARTAAGFLSFIPVYALTLAILFLFNPALRLIFADLIRRHPTSRSERFSALGIVLSFIPLSAIWVFVLW